MGCFEYDTYVHFSERTCYPEAVKVTATHLRQNIYAILDEVLESGVVVEVERKGRVVRIAAGQAPKLARIKKRKSVVIGDPDDLIHLDWSKEWTELKK